MIKKHHKTILFIFITNVILVLLLSYLNLLLFENYDDAYFAKKGDNVQMFFSGFLFLFSWLLPANLISKKINPKYAHLFLGIGYLLFFCILHGFDMERLLGTVIEVLPLMASTLVMSFIMQIYLDKMKG